MNRKPFKFTWSDFKRTLLKKLCCCCPCAKSKSFKKANKLSKLFEKGQAKLAESLDITKLIEMA